MAQACTPAELRERLPEYVRQKTDENMRQHVVFFLMPNGTNSQVALLNTKGQFGRRQLDVSFPEFFVCPISYVAAQHVTSVGKRCLLAMRILFGPSQLRATVHTTFNLDVEQPRCTRVGSL